jgi:hypothetical protein
MQHVACLASAVLALSAVAHAGVTQIPVANPSFESPAMSACTWGPGATGWTSGSVWHCGVEDQCFYDSFPNGPSDGLQVGFTNGPNAPIVQVLSETLVANETYTLRVDIGMRNDIWHVEDYRVRLYAGSTLLAEDPGLLYPKPGTWETSVVFFATPPNHPAIGQPLAIHLVLIEGAQANFDNVRLTKGETGDPALLGDLNGDGTVNAADLTILLSQWGGAGNGDLNGDGVVNAADLTIMLSAWTG